MQAIIAKILAWFGGAAVQNLIKNIPAVVAAVEDEYKKAFADGKITPTERKELAVLTINTIADKFGLKMNFITKWIVSTLIDSIAKKLPSSDIQIPDIVFSITKEW